MKRDKQKGHVALVLRRTEGEGFQQELMEHQLGQEGKFKWYTKTMFQGPVSRKSR